MIARKLVVERYHAKQDRWFNTWTQEQRRNVIEFAETTCVRRDWHEPDEQDVTATVGGNNLDNAMGNSGECGEFVITLYDQDIECVRVNLASLLADYVELAKLHLDVVEEPEIDLC